MSISRRDLLGFAASFGLPNSLLPIEALAQARPTPGPPMPMPVRIRENISTFATNPNKVATLRAAVKRMKQRSTTNLNDPLGWSYWAAIHGTTVTPPSSLMAIYNQCTHSGANMALHFVSWHRAYLYFFESVLKKAAIEAGQTTALELPYWDWYTARKIPSIFLTGNASTNPLWHSRQVVDLTGYQLAQTAFDFADLLPGGSVSMYNTFSYDFEIDPHGEVHGDIGGDMGDVPTSARDPIFFLHHANIDRLWTAWMKGGTRVVPAANSTWGQTTWKFDVAGNWKQTAGAMLDSQGSLNYRYDNEAMPLPVSIVVAQAQRVIEGKPSSVDVGELKRVAPPGATGMPNFATISSTSGGLSLGNSAVAVNLPFTPQHSKQLREFSVSSGTSEIKSASLVLEDVRVGANGKRGGFSFKIVASLPDASGRRVVLGSLNTFTLSARRSDGDKHQHGEATSKQTLVFPLTDVLPALGLSDPSALEKGLRVTFEPSHPPKAGSTPDFIKIGAVKINASPLADR